MLLSLVLVAVPFFQYRELNGENHISIILSLVYLLISLFTFNAMTNLRNPVHWLGHTILTCGIPIMILMGFTGSYTSGLHYINTRIDELVSTSALQENNANSDTTINNLPINETNKEIEFKHNNADKLIDPQAATKSSEVHEYQSSIKVENFSVTTVNNQRVFSETEEIVLIAQTSTTGKLYIFSKQADGSRIMLFPNYWETDNTLNSKITIPSAGAGYSIEPSPPFGEETIEAYLLHDSAISRSDSNLLKNTIKRSSSFGVLDEATYRNILIKAKETSEAAFIAFNEIKLVTKP